MSNTAAIYQRTPLVISGNSMISGEFTRTFRNGDPVSLFRTYLVWVREMRDQRRAPSIRLREEDIEVIADYLHVGQDEVLGGLMGLMSATQATRTKMMALMAAGALTVVVSGAIVTDLSSDGVSVEFSRLADAIQRVIPGSDTATTDVLNDIVIAEPSTRTATETVTEPAVTGTITEPATQPVSEAATLLAETTLITPTADALQSASAAATAPTVTETGTETATEPVATAVLEDGSTVAVVAPPVAPVTPDEPVATTVLPDGSTVGVVAPPVPVPQG
jgi:hypothetical protein